MRASVTAVIKAVTCFIIPIAVILLLIGVRNLSGNVNGNTIGDVVSRVGGAIIGMIPSGMFLLASVALFQSVIRLSKRKIVVKDLYCIEMLARVNVLCLDKTGTITDGTMRVVEVSENPASRIIRAFPTRIRSPRQRASTPRPASSRTSSAASGGRLQAASIDRAIGWLE